MEHGLPPRLPSSFYPHASTAVRVGATLDQRKSSRSGGLGSFPLSRTPENIGGSPGLNSCHSVSPSSRGEAGNTGRPNTFGASARGQASLTSGDIRKTAHHYLRRPDIQ